MKYITFTASGVLAGLANMLEHFGIDTEDYTIALGMDAPFLFLREGGHYLAGSKLYHPRWLDLYLRPRGFHMSEITLPKEEVAALLRSQKTAMLPITVTNGNTHPVVFTRYSDGRYEFVNIKRPNAAEPNAISLSSAMLKRRLADQVTIYTLESCPPQSVDFLPLLQASLQNLDAYLNDVGQALHCTVTRQELRSMHTPLFRALMQDMHPMAALIGDFTLAEELRQLNHDYRHIFTRNSPPTIELYEKLPRSSIRKCVAWLKENINDQIHVHTEQNKQHEARSRCNR